PVGIAIHRCAAERIDPVDVSPLVSPRRAQVEARRIRHQGSASGRPSFVTCCAASCRGVLAPCEATEFRDTGLSADESYRSAFCTLTQQHALRPAQHLDAIKIECQRQCATEGAKAVVGK